VKKTLQYLVIFAGLTTAAILVWTYLFPAGPPPEKSPAELRVDLVEGESREVRAAAAAKLGALRDIDSMPLLLTAMQDEDAIVRARSAAAVMNILGADFSFRSDDPIEIRRAAIERIRRHWEAWLKKGLPGG
jgi:hypothetical protein